MASSSLIMGNNMHVKYLAGIVGAALLMAGCSSSNELSAAGQSVRIVDEQPGAECQLIGTATGKQSNWLSGQHVLCAAQQTICATRRLQWAVT